MRKVAKQTGQPCVNFTTGESTWDWFAVNCSSHTKSSAKEEPTCPSWSSSATRVRQGETLKAGRDVMRMQIAEVGLQRNEHPGNIMDRKITRPKPAVAGPRQKGPRETPTPGGHRSQSQVIQTLGGPRPPQARIGTHGTEATHFIGTRGSRAMHALAWNSRWWGELTVVGRIIEFIFQLIHERTDGKHCL